MSKYLAVAFSDLERHSIAWGSVPRDQMIAVVAEYRYLAERLASTYGCLYLEWTGDGHMFLFENADSAVRFGLELVDEWKRAGAEPSLPLRVGCHFGECTPMDGAGWIGRGNSIAKRVEGEAASDSVYVTESVLDLLDLPLYGFEHAGSFRLKGDALDERSLYAVRLFDREALEERAPEQLSAEDWFLKAVALIGTAKENTEEEAECYRDALRLRPDYAEAHTNYAILLRSRGEQAEAARHYQEALTVRPDYPEAHYNYAAMLATRGSVRGSMEHYREALRLRADYVDAHHGLARLLHANGELEEAAGHYREALRLRPDYAEAHSNYAILLEDLEDHAGAVEQFREALRIRPNYAEAHYNYALLLEQLEKTERAEEHYREALRIWPDYGEAHNNLAILLQSRGAGDEAERHYCEALRVRPEDPETHYNYALLLRSRGETAEAGRHFRIAHELAPEVAAFRSALDSPA